MYIVEMLLAVLFAVLSVSAEDLEKGACQQNQLSVECGLELRPDFRDLAGNATLMSSDLTKMTLAGFLDVLTDSSLREILVTMLRNSIRLAAQFSLNSLEGDRTKLRQTILGGLLDLSDQFIDITKHFMENDYVGSSMSSALERLRKMSDSSESILSKMGRTNLSTFIGFTTVETALGIVARCLDPQRARAGCVLLLDTKKFVIKNIRSMVVQ